MSLLDDKIDFILDRIDYINSTLMTRMSARVDIYGKINTKISIEITKLMYLLQSKSWFGENLKLELYKKLIDMTRKQGLIYKIFEPVPVDSPVVYYGVAPAALAEVDIKSTLLAVDSVKQDNELIYTTVLPEVYYYAYPKSWGNLSKIYDDNGFNTINGYIVREVQIPVDILNIDYYLYEFDTASVTTDFHITFKF